MSLNRLLENSGSGVLEVDEGGFIRPHEGGLPVHIRELAFADPLPAGPFMVLRLTSAQLSLLYECRMRPDSTAYQINAPIFFETPVSRERVERAFRQVLNRHAALRTTFRRAGAGFFQVISGKPEPHFFSRRLENGSPNAVRRAMAPDVAIPVDITLQSHRIYFYERDGLVRACALVVHHAVGDLPSAATIIDDLGRLLADPEAPAPEDPYIQFIQAQQKTETGRAAERNRAFWLEQLTPLPEPADLPADSPRPAFQSQKSADYGFRVEAELRERLRALAEACGSDELTILLSAFQVFLAFWTGRADTAISMAAPTSTRRRFPTVIAFGVQEVPLLAHVDFDAAFADLLTENRRRQFQLFKHRDVSLLLFSSELGLVPDPGRSAVAEHAFIAYPEKGHNHILGECSRSTMGHASGVMTYGEVRFNFLPAVVPHWQHELTLISGYDPEPFLPLIFRYHTGLYGESTIARFARAYLHILETLVDHPDSILSETQLLPPDERELLSGWVRNARPVPPRLVLDLFEDRARSTPNAPALVCEGRRLTYAELNAWANRGARFLQTDHEVMPGTPVGLLFHPSPDMIVSMLAVLKAGGAFVPIDPDQPVQRTVRMAEDSGFGLVLTHEPLADTVLPGLQLAGLPTAPITGHNIENPSRRISPGQPAYIIFTSGSTGAPKGVVVSHQNFMACQAGLLAAPGLQAEDRVLSVFNYAFDGSLITNALPLLAGACVVLAGKEQRGDPRELIRLMEDEDVTWTCATASHYRMLKLAGWQGRSGMTAGCGGESLPDDLADFLVATCGQVWNLYGTTEGSNVSTTYRLKGKEDPVPIGHPLEGAQLYILNEAGMQAPPGVRGTLYLGGDFVATGYAAQPGMTAERFVPDPFGEAAGGRLYSTGDIVSFRSDGALLYHGRSDGQAKVRGHRVETGEIEQVLNRHPSVSTSVVVAVQKPDAATRVEAYIVLVDGEAITGRSITEHLAEHLPAFMLPTSITMVDSIPTTPNGKVDIATLPAPALRSPEPGGAHFKGVETRIAAAWSDVLDREGFDREDNFFELGGDSLRLLELVLQLENVFGERLALAGFVRRPTVAGMAAALEESFDWGRAGRNNLLVPIKPAGSKPIFWVSAGYGDLIAYQRWESIIQADQQLFILQSPDEFTGRAAGLAADYIDALRSVYPEGPFTLAGHSFGGLLAYEMAQQLARQGQPVRKLILIDTPAGYPAKMGGTAGWLKKVMKLAEREKDGRGLIEAMLADRGWQVHLQALEGYQPEEYDGNMTLITTLLSRPFLRIGRWRRLVRGTLTVNKTGGNHHTMLRDHAGELLDLI